MEVRVGRRTKGRMEPERVALSRQGCREDGKNGQHNRHRPRDGSRENGKESKIEVDI